MTRFAINAQLVRCAQRKAVLERALLAPVRDHVAARLRSRLSTLAGYVAMLDARLALLPAEE